MKYIVNGTEEFTTAREAAEYIMENCDEEHYDNMLDDCYGEVKIGSMCYSPSLVLYRIDEVAYSCGRSDWEDAEASDIAYELERMDAGDEEDFYNYTVSIEDDEA